MGSKMLQIIKRPAGKCIMDRKKKACWADSNPGRDHQHLFCLAGDPVSMVYPVANDPDDVVARQQQPGMLLVYPRDFLINKEIA